MALKRLLIALLFALVAAPALAQSGPGASGHDPCAYAVRVSVPISIAGPGVISLVPPSGAASIYVCGVSVTFSAAPFNSMTLGYAAAVPCVAPVALSGPIGLSIPVGQSANPLQGSTAFNAGGANTLFTAPAGTGLCASASGGQAASVSGVLTYVQQ